MADSNAENDRLKPLRAAIAASYLADEAATVATLLSELNQYPITPDTVSQYALSIIAAVRENPRLQDGVEAFLTEYSLNSDEGMVLMGLAEALLRIPDAQTQQTFIEDKIKRGDWESHMGHSTSWRVNASTWGLILTGKLLNPVESTSVQTLLQKLFRNSSEPLLRNALSTAMKLMGGQFVLAEDIDDALHVTKESANKKYRFSFDMLGEAALTNDDAETFFKSYMNAIEVTGANIKKQQKLFERPSISVKLSALHPRYHHSKWPRLEQTLLPRIKALCMAAKLRGLSITIDAEEAERLELSLNVFDALWYDPDLAGWPGLGLAVQAYQKRALPVLRWLQALAQERKTRIPVRLVKGAYWDTEIKNAQMLGLAGYPVFTRKEHTDVSYLTCAMFLGRNKESFYAQFATHNAHTVAFLLAHLHDSDYFEFQRLHGMGEALYDDVLAEHPQMHCRVYAPVGQHEKLLPYLVRRILENGASTSFVHRIADLHTPASQLSKNPINAARESGGKASRRIPLPIDVFLPIRKNSRGFDFNHPDCQHAIDALMQKGTERTWIAESLIVGTCQTKQSSELLARYNPANTDETIGQLRTASVDDLRCAVYVGWQAYETWHQIPAAERAEVLNAIADRLEAEFSSLVYLLVKESGKTVPDAIAEIREAADFCRYYAYQACHHFALPQELISPTGETNILQWRGRGVFACVSPWNFPLAIFTGQIVAALVAGNSVIAKPASQTSLIAHYTTQLMHEAGIPKDVLQLTLCSGQTFSKQVIANPRIAGVAFTGSSATARSIQQTLVSEHEAIIPFIAETGGLNAMIVDSSALPEQVVKDAVVSAFFSAGQRCSALRILFVQEDIAEHLFHLLKGAIEELDVGDPQLRVTDLGPVIDDASRRSLMAHIAFLDTHARCIARTPLSSDLPNGTYLAPCAYEIPNLSLLKEEQFGPILHVVRFKAGAIKQVIEQINQTGYGLTLGIQSRIDQHIELVKNMARVGNTYINRNMVGAVVGVQPFGGEGLSGTGPKAGGPHYLQRFATERTITTNTAAIGGNTTLLTDKN